MEFEIGECVQVIAYSELKTGVITDLYKVDALVKFDSGDQKDACIPFAYMMKLDQPKPVKVPKMIANFIESYDNTIDRYNILAKALEFLSDVYNESNEVDEWIDNNMTQFIRAVLDGYEVKKEPLYYVDFINYGDVHKRLILDHENCKYNIVDWSDNLIGLVQEMFTEQEIKELDERYWAFAVPVEEVEAE